MNRGGQHNGVGFVVHIGVRIMNQSRFFRQKLFQFIEYLESGEAFEDPDCGRMYDVGLCAQVIGACLDNLRVHGSEGFTEQVPLYLDAEQKQVLAIICKHLSDEW
jgi:hypothetical protein